LSARAPRSFSGPMQRIASLRTIAEGKKCMPRIPDLSPEAPRPQNPRPIISIGAGGIVRDAHLPAYRKAGFPVVAITDLDQSKAEGLARQFSIPKVLTRVEDAVAYAPDHAVFDIAVPASALVQLLAKLPDGAAVLLQKPMGETLSEARAILEICRTKHLTAAVNFQLRFAPNMLAARQLQESGALGKIHDMEVKVSVMTPWHLWDFLQKAPRTSLTQARTTGPCVRVTDTNRSAALDGRRAPPDRPRGRGSCLARTGAQPGAPVLRGQRPVALPDSCPRRAVLLLLLGRTRPPCPST